MTSAPTPVFRNWSIKLLGCLTVLITTNSLTYANAWRGIVPLHATRTTVEKRLGRPTTDRGDTVVYDFESERASIEYSKGSCSVKLSEWNVPRDTVISVWVTPKRDLNFRDLGLGGHYKMVRDEGRLEVIHYIDGDAGIEYNVHEPTGIVGLIKYVPTTGDKILRCPLRVNEVIKPGDEKRVVSHRASAQKRLELINLTSPDATYRVDFKERAGSPRPTRHEVQFDVFRRDLRIIKDEQFYEGGIYDDKFSELYPEHHWTSPAVLRFGRKDNVPESQHDEVSIQNATERTVTYLRVNVGKYEAFLLLDLKPGSIVTLSAQPQTDNGQDLSFIGCKGRFDDGTPIREEAGNFLVRGKYHGPAHYSIKISDKDVQISSREFASLSESAR